jgi:hypothetical protein
MAEVVALLDAYVVSGCVGRREGGWDCKHNELLSGPLSGSRLCFMPIHSLFDVVLPIHGREGAHRASVNYDGVMAASTTTNKERGRFKEED